MLRYRVERSEWLNALVLLVGATSLLLLALLMSSCGGAGVIRFKVANETKQTITFKASAGIFSRSITLEPGTWWEGWCDPRFATKSVVVAVR